METSLAYPSIIVAADDDAEDSDLLRLLLRKAGVPGPIEFYREGEAIIGALKRWLKGTLKAPPILCFLDIKMPAMSGHDVLQWIRGQKEFDRLPVVMLSSSEHPNDIKRAIDGGAQCYLSKYPQPAVLRRVIEDAERFALGAPAEECFRMPTNLLLVRGRRL